MQIINFPYCNLRR